MNRKKKEWFGGTLKKAQEILEKNKKNTSGFTLVELMVVLVIVGIMTSMAVIAGTGYIDYANFKRQNEYAQTIYSAAQNRLTEYSTSGYLSQLEATMQECGDEVKSVNLESLTASDGTTYSLGKVWAGSNGKYTSTVYSLIGTPEDYKHYKSKEWSGYSAKKRKAVTALYEMIENYMYDDGILSSGVVCVEFTALDGQVFAAFYSDKNTDFEYNNGNENKRGLVNIQNRERSYRKARMVGYYGVDTLAKATTTKAQRPVISYVKLNNEETLNLSFRLTKVTDAWNQLTYEVYVYNSVTDKLDLRIEIDATQKDLVTGRQILSEYKGGELKNVKIQGKVTRYWYSGEETPTEKELGTYEFPMMVDKDGTMRLVLDAVDLNATTKNYTEGYNVIGNKNYQRGITETSFSDIQKNAAEALNNSYSLHRFGLSAEKVYCAIQGSGSSYKTTILRTSNRNVDAYYANGSRSKGVSGEKEYTYSLENARHLYNMRFIEDLNELYSDGISVAQDDIYTKYPGNEGSYVVPETATWEVSKDFSWQDMVAKGYVFKGMQSPSKITLSEGGEAYYYFGKLSDLKVEDIPVVEGEIVEAVDTADIDGQIVIKDTSADGKTQSYKINKIDMYVAFPSIRQLRAGSVFQTEGYTKDGVVVSSWNSNKNKSIGYLTITSQANKDAGIECYEYQGENPEKVESTGLFLSNSGDIRSITLDNIVVSGMEKTVAAVGELPKTEMKDNVGAFCGRNSGELVYLTVNSTSGRSAVRGKDNVGGIFGFQTGVAGDSIVQAVKDGNVTVTTTGNGNGNGNTQTLTGRLTLKFEHLVNRASVKGNYYIGGIVGQLATQNDSGKAWHLMNAGIGIDKNGGIPYTITTKIWVEDCNNYGALMASQTAGDTEVRFIGGIIGYAKNGLADKNNESSIENFVIKSCTSSPQYRSSDLDTILSGDNLQSYLKGVYVGGIAGYNDWCKIENCNTKNESNDKIGYIFGYQYVGGIVGYNSGPASGIEGSNNANQANVVGNTYIGGITGCNANVEKDENGKFVDKEGNKFDNVTDPNIIIPSNERALTVKISNWTNNGVIVGQGDYVGGITGYNTGWIFGCNSDVDTSKKNSNLTEIRNKTGNYAGGIAGYNNGYIGNTERDPENNYTAGDSGKKLYVTCNISGHDYVGGIVGYNDVDALIEDYVLEGGNILGNGDCVGGYVGANTSICLLEYTDATKVNGKGHGDARDLASNPNVVQGSYYVGGIIGANIVATKENLFTEFVTDNFLGNITANAYVGGFIGYNCLLADQGDDVKEDVLSYVNKLCQVNNEDKSENNLYSQADLGTNFQTISNQFTKESQDANTGLLASEYKLTISGILQNNTSSKFGSITAQICVGGVVGYSDDNASLEIKNVVNLTPVTATDSISNNSEQPGRDDKNFTYSYCGGIIGKVSRNVVVDNCKNQDVGDVVSEGTYTGAIAEINDGIIRNCDASSIGNAVQDYVGGICGVNLYIVEDCTVKDSTVTGNNHVGGVVSENFGRITGTKLTNASISASGENVGGIAGYNSINDQLDQLVDNSLADSYVELSEDGTRKLALGITVSSASTVNVTGGDNVGGLVGNNESMLKIDEALSSSDGDATTSGTVTGNKSVGGIIGSNIAEVSGFYSKSIVTAYTANAGGIIGENRATENAVDISNCVNSGSVTASKGNAGGIVALNAADIKNSVNTGNVSATNGDAGGITASNSKEAVIENCSVVANKEALWWKNFIQWLEETFFGKDNSVTIMALNNVGGICGTNSGVIRNNILEDISVINTVNSNNNSLVGGIAGDNMGTIELQDEAVAKCSVETLATESNAGGIVGRNRSTGVIKAIEDTVVLSDVNVRMSDSVSYCNLGGVAGTQEAGGKIENYHISADIGRNTSLGSDNTGYGGIVGINSGTIEGSSFDGSVLAGGSASGVANIGGIAGKNEAAGDIVQCTVGVDPKNKETLIQSGKGTANDQAATANLGGMIGWNFGTLMECNNYGTDEKPVSTDDVNIIGSAGYAGGLIGRQEAGAVVTGSSEQRTSTGKQWTVKAFYYYNDSGTGGICGWSGSGKNISYVDNHATVKNVSGKTDSTAVGGMIGRLENQETTDFTIYNCKNYGVIGGPSNTGGMVGRWKYNGGTLQYCENYGEVGKYFEEGKSKNPTNFGGGMIGSPYDLSDYATITFNNCLNQGEVYGQNVGGMVGSSDSCNSKNVMVFNDCVNNGTLYGTTSSGGIISNNTGSRTSVAFYRCRNYGESGNNKPFAGIVYDASNVLALKDCFDYATKGSGLTNNMSKNIANSYYYTGSVLTSEQSEADLIALKGKEVADKLAEKNAAETEKNQAESEQAVLESKLNDAQKKIDAFSLYTDPDKVYIDEDTTKASFDAVNIDKTKVEGVFESMFNGAVKSLDAKDRYQRSTAKNVSPTDPINLTFGFAENKVGNSNQYPLIKSFGMFWGANGSNQFTRLYVYYVSYVAVDTESVEHTYYLKGNSEFDDADTINIRTNIEKNIGKVVYKPNGNEQSVDNIDDATLFYSYGVANIQQSYAIFGISEDVHVKSISFDLQYANSIQGNMWNTVEKGQVGNLGTGITVREFAATTGNEPVKLTSTDATSASTTSTCTLLDSNSLELSGWKNLKDAYDVIVQQLSAKYTEVAEKTAAYEAAAAAWQKSSEELEEGDYSSVRVATSGKVPTLDENKSGNVLYAIKFDSQYLITSEVSPLKDLSIPSSTARKNQCTLTALGYEGLETTREVLGYSLMEQYYIDVANKKQPDEPKEEKLSIVVSGGKINFRIPYDIDNTAYGYQICYVVKDSDGNELTNDSTVDSPSFIYNAVTDNNEGGKYITYQVDMKQEWYDGSITFYVRAINGTAYETYYDADGNFRDLQTQYKAPTAEDWNQDGQYIEQNVSKWSSKETMTYQPQVIPSVYLELGVKADGVKVVNNSEKDDNLCWTAVLEHMDQYAVGTKIYVYLNSSTNTAGTATFTIEIREDASGKTYCYTESKYTSEEQLGNLNFSAKAGAVNSGSVNRSESGMVMYQNYFIGAEKLKGQSHETTTWNGFYGNMPDNLNYHINLAAAQKRDIYVDTEMVVKDYMNVVYNGEEYPLDVAVSSGQSHVTDKVQGGVTSVLSKLPENLLEQYNDVAVQSYPWMNQWYVCRYGHIVAESISVDQIIDYTDPQRGGERIYNINIDSPGLNPGYVIRANSDGTYKVIYSVFLANEDIYANQVTRNSMKVTQSTTTIKGTVVGNKTLSLSMQLLPDIDTTYDVAANEGGHATYTFKWNTKRTAQTTDLYELRLYGSNSDDGEKTLLQTVTTSDKQYTFVDQNDKWSYSRLTLRVIQVGTPTDDPTLKSTLLPFYTERMFTAKLQLAQIARPTVQLRTLDGTSDKDHMIYNVLWNGLTDEEQKEGLLAYHIHVSRSNSDRVANILSADNVEAIKKNLAHHGFIEQPDGQWKYEEAGVVEKTAVFTQNEDNITYTMALDEIWIVSQWTVQDKNQITHQIDLQDYLGGETVNISVKAVAKEESKVYKDGPEGVVREMQLPVRLTSPEMKAVTVDLKEYGLSISAENDVVYTIDDMNDNGVTLTMKGTPEYILANGTRNGKYEMKLEFYEPKIIDGMETSPVGDDGEMQEGCVAKYELSSTQITSGSLENGTYNLKGDAISVIDNEGNAKSIRLSDCAGLYLVVSMRSISDSRISSYWTNESLDVSSYVSFRLPKVQHDTPGLEKNTSPEKYGNVDVVQSSVIATGMDYATDYVMMVMHKAQTLDKSLNQNGEILYMDWIYAEATEDGDYQVFYLTSDTAVMSQYPYEAEAPISKYNTAAIYLGKMPADFEDVRVSIPYTLNVVSGVNTEVITETYLSYNSEKRQFTLVLADAEQVGTSADETVEYERTTQVMVQGLAVDGSNYHVSSAYASWYRESGKVTTIENASDPIVIDDLNAFDIFVSSRNNISWDICSSDPVFENLIYRIDTGDEIIYKSAYAYKNTATMDSILMLAKEEYGDTTKVEVMGILSSGAGFTKWSSPKELDFSKETEETEIEAFNKGAVEEDEIICQVVQDVVSFNMRADVMDYSFTLIGTKNVGEIYLVYNSVGKYYHVFYKDSQNQKLNYPISGIAKANTDDYDITMLGTTLKDGESYPACEYEPEAYYLGDIQPDDTISLPFSFSRDVVNDNNIYVLTTTTALGWTGTGFNIILPDVKSAICNNETILSGEHDIQIAAIIPQFADTSMARSQNQWYRSGEGYKVSNDIITVSELSITGDPNFQITFSDGDSTVSVAATYDKTTKKYSFTGLDTTYSLIIGTTVDNETKWSYHVGENSEWALDLSKGAVIKVKVVRLAEPKSISAWSNSIKIGILNMAVTESESESETIKETEIETEGETEVETESVEETAVETHTEAVETELSTKASEVETQASSRQTLNTDETVVEEMK